MSACSVAIVGVGLVGRQVVHQLLSPALSSLFKVVSLSNSKHTLHLSPGAPALDAETLLSLLPPSSAPLPETSAHPAASYAVAEPAELVKRLAADAKKNAGGKTAHTILIDCTSDLKVTELYPTAIASGLSVVTPNKKGFSSSSQLFDKIVEAQSAPGAGLVYLEATVGAGLPIISTLRDLLKTGDEVTKIEGVFSGTMSYIFNEFSKPAATGPGPKFSEIVKVAKENGYTVRGDSSEWARSAAHYERRMLIFRSKLSRTGAAPGRRPLGFGRRAQAHDPLPPRLDQPLVPPRPPRPPRRLRLPLDADPDPLGPERHRLGRRVCRQVARTRCRV